VQPAKNFTGAEGPGSEAGQGGEGVGGLVVEMGLLLGLEGEDGAFARVDEPAEFCAVVEEVENVVDDAGLVLVGGEDFDRPIGGNVKVIGDVAFGTEGDARPGKDAEVWDKGAIADGTAQFGEGMGTAIGEGVLINGANESGLEQAMLAFGHGFGPGLTVDIFLGGGGFGLL